jgi:hypothetical protein
VTKLDVWADIYTVLAKSVVEQAKKSVFADLWRDWAFQPFSDIFEEYVVDIARANIAYSHNPISSLGIKASSISLSTIHMTTASREGEMFLD